MLFNQYIIFYKKVIIYILYGNLIVLYSDYSQINTLTDRVD